ncbi:MAG: tyrosine--tRNA ligase [Patescibacteria group bacterium]
MIKKFGLGTDTNIISRFLTRAVENVYPTPEKLGELLASGNRITVYLGIDPTGQSLHIGHAIAIRKIAELQKLGHRVILLIGDFTGMIGDPTDKSATRKRLTRDEVLANCKVYQKQASTFLEFEGPNAAELKFNSEWLAKMSFQDVIELAAHFTVQQMLERDMFEKRIEEGKPIYFHEFLYPLMQGYDSVAMNVDLEIGGNDQTFNMLAGRTLMREMKQKEKFVLTTKLLTDPTGKKMGKTEGNMITLADEATDMYGKVMSWTDGMIVPGFELCTDVSDNEIRDIQSRIADGENPVIFKRRLAHEIVATFVSKKAADEAETHFAQVHQKHEVPEDIQVYKVSARGVLPRRIRLGRRSALGGQSPKSKVIDVLVECGLVASRNEARRQIEQGGVKINGEVVHDGTMMVTAGSVIQKGKRHFVRLV